MNKWSGLILDVLEAGKIGGCKDLGDLDKDRIMMSRRQDQSVSVPPTFVLPFTDQDLRKSSPRKEKQSIGSLGSLITRGVKTGLCHLIQLYFKLLPLLERNQDTELCRI